MVSRQKSESATVADDPLAETIREMRAERARLLAEGIDPDEEVDRIAEELFGSPEATAVLLDYLKATDEGRRWEWLYGTSEDDAGLSVAPDAAFGGLTMTALLPSQPASPAETRLRQHAEELRRERNRLAVELGDLDEAFDRIAEELFGRPGETEALLETVLEDVFGEDTEEALADHGR